MAYKAYIDFDGTISREDVGNAFFRRFGGEACVGYVAAYRNQEISARECYRRESALVGRLDVREASEFVTAQQIDPAFVSFADFCASRSIDLQVVSDGLDFYVERILAANGLGHLVKRANHLRFGTGGEALVEYPHSDAECALCGCCKRNIMLTSTADDDIIVYAGDGYSDRCPVRYADIVFAKGDLQAFCQRENISHYVYASFADITARMTELLGRKSVRHGKTAALRRRAIFEAEA